MLLIYKLLESLRGEAIKSNGKVYTILGNHDIMNAMNDWRKYSAY